MTLLSITLIVAYIMAAIAFGKAIYPVAERVVPIAGERNFAVLFLSLFWPVALVAILIVTIFKVVVGHE